MRRLLAALLDLAGRSRPSESPTALRNLFAAVMDEHDVDPGPTSELVVDAESSPRTLNTLSRDLLVLFNEQTRDRGLSDAGWQTVCRACDELHAGLRGLVRCGSDELKAVALQAIQHKHSCALVFVDIDIEAQFSRELNHALAQTVSQWRALASGEAVLDGLLRGIGPLVPLTTVCGQTMANCVRTRLDDNTVRYSTTKKLTLVAGEMEAILGRTPVDCMQPGHVTRYIQMLRAKGNSPGTVENKLGVLASLVGNLAPEATRDALRRKRPPRAAVEALRKKRRPMTRRELGTFLSAIFNDTSLNGDDRVIVALTALTSARIDEIASLQACDIKWDGSSWSVAITLSDDERESIRQWMPQGFAFPGLKGAESKRTIPVYANVVPGLHERLLTLVERPGNLFKHVTRTSAGRMASAVGQRINRRMKAIFGEDTDLVFESLRNTGSPALRRAGVTWDLRRAHMGHVPVDIHARHYDEVTYERPVVSREVV